MDSDETPGDFLTETAERLFGLKYLFPYQRLVISNILDADDSAGGDAAETNDRAALGCQIVILPTGAGKSLCFQLPAVLLQGATLVIYPILSLMADQERRLRELAALSPEHGVMTPALLRGGQSPEERGAVFRQIRNGERRFIIANPEVLLTEAVMKELPALNIAHVVIDEAHCVSEWGESFRPDYLRLNEIIAACKSGTGPLVTAFTATASETVLEKIDRFVFAAAGLVPRRVIGNPDRPNIAYSARGVLCRDLAVRDLLDKMEKPAIVFCSSREGTEKLARYLRDCPNPPAGTEVKFYHAGLEREEKTSVEKWFFESGGGVLVSTCAYGMGVDKSNIRGVIHRDCPPSVEAYLQESGRAGRDGRPSRACLLWGAEDLRRLALKSSGGRFADLIAYARDITRCRRAALQRLLDYEGDGTAPGTECCDVCSSAASGRYREEASLLAFFRRNRRCYGINEAARFLSESKLVRWREDEAKHAIRSLIAEGKLKQVNNIFWKGKITVQDPKG
ncbi:MAG: RecQ family ATP-dependent DNA helicase [Treponema sp.]|jgi:ATP-dependent DNA helicase RecQ|nr:RecQ family ATP-dependent DNA helicase [Treponema sp.]